MRFAVLLITLLLLPHLAVAANIYEVKDVTVAIAGTDTTKQRDQAMAEAEKKAFEELQKKLIAGGYISEAKTISEAQISAAVDSLDIVNEKIGAKDYRATYNIVFSTVEISRIFAINEIQPVEDPQKYLIIPITSENGALKIWKNDWLKDWTEQKHDDIILPLGDLQDVQNLKTEDLTAHKYEGIFRMEERYGANNIVLLTAEFHKDKNALAVKLEKIKDHERTAITYEYPGKPGITVADIYGAAAKDIIYRLENNKLTDNSLVVDANSGNNKTMAPKIPEPYSPMAPGTGYIGEKRYNTDNLEPQPFPPIAPTQQVPQVQALPPLTPPAQPAQPSPKVPLPPIRQATQPAPPAAANIANHSDVIVIAPDLIAWSRIRNKIAATPGIANFQIKSLIAGKAHITLFYEGDVQSLKSVFAANGLEFDSDAAGNLELKEKP